MLAALKLVFLGRIAGLSPDGWTREPGGALSGA